MYIPGLDKLIGKLGDVLAKEAGLIWRVPHEIKDFKTELENMQLFLIDADQDEMHAEVEKKWVADIKDKAYEAEDIIDEFTYHLNKHHHDDDISCLSWFLHLLVDAPTTLWVKRQTTHKLKKIKKSITDIAERHAKYKAGASAHDAAGRAHTRYLKQQQAVTNLRDGAYFVLEENFIGLHRQIESLQQWVKNDKSSSRNVISVYGMGGAGKTTLAAKIFKTQRGGFKLSAWVTISQTYSITELLRSLIKKVSDINQVADLNKREEENKVADRNKGEEERYLELVETLRGCLKEKKYLIVLDDVWDDQVWKQMEAAFPEDKVSSRILITTRDERNVPSPYKLEVGKLEGSEPWDLFSIKAFADYPDKTCPQELESFARELVDKCIGLPLALVTLGSHMSSKKQKEEWSDAYTSLYKSADIDYVKNILMLSLNDLSYSHKHCFLYCCIFPEDYPIKRGRLIRRWVAEGFVEGGDGKTPEEVAGLWLLELVFRGMLLVETRDVSGRPKVIKMHDVMREFALKLAKKEKFCAVWDGKDAMNKSEAYRWSIIHSSGRLKLPSSEMSQVRFLSVFRYPSFEGKHLRIFKRLRVLDLEFLHRGSEPIEVGYLFHLRYLRLPKKGIQMLPGSIGGLLNLQTLDISSTRIQRLPKEVCKLRQLRHLIMPGVSISFDISKLNELQVLMGVVIDTGEKLRQLGTLTQLKKLGIYCPDDNLTGLGGRKNWEMLGALKLLQCFCLDTNLSDFILPLNLKKLHFLSERSFESRCVESLDNLQEMILEKCTVSRDELHGIGALEGLVRLVLTLGLGDDEEEVHFCGGFAKLKQLSLHYSKGLKRVSFVEKGAMPRLESLSIRYCRDSCFEELPQGIEHLTNVGVSSSSRPQRQL